jgi:hypothetical protein
MRNPIVILAAGLVLAVLTSCTPKQLAAWHEWHAQDPAAAEAFAEQWKADYAAAQQSAPRTGQDESESHTSVSAGGSVWDKVAYCESGGNWAINTGNGYSGGLQFLHASWNAYGGQEFAARAYQASREQQIIVAERILADVGWKAWPACSRRLGLR